jgi:hypothetical protein
MCAAPVAACLLPSPLVCLSRKRAEPQQLISLYNAGYSNCRSLSDTSPQWMDGSNLNNHIQIKDTPARRQTIVHRCTFQAQLMKGVLHITLLLEPIGDHCLVANHRTSFRTMDGLLAGLGPTDARARQPHLRTSYAPSSFWALYPVSNTGLFAPTDLVSNLLVNSIHYTFLLAQ